MSIIAHLENINAEFVVQVCAVSCPPSCARSPTQINTELGQEDCWHRSQWPFVAAGPYTRARRQMSPYLEETFSSQNSSLHHCIWSRVTIGLPSVVLCA